MASFETNKKLVEVMMTNFNLKRHLKNIKNYLLMGKFFIKPIIIFRIRRIFLDINGNNYRRIK